MKAISLWQPWASLIAAGVKSIETRHWRVSHRGPLAIHAAKRIEIDHIPAALRGICDDAFGDQWPADLPRGAVVATAGLIECRATGSIGAPPDWVMTLGDIERNCGDFSLGRFGWVLDNVCPLPSPIPLRGRQGLFEIPDAILSDGCNTEQHFKRHP